MKQRIKDFWQWVKEHKWQLLAAGISITAVIAAIINAQKKEEIDSILSELNEAAQKVSPEDAANGNADVGRSMASEPVLEVYDSEVHTITQQIPLFIRELPDGWHHSPEKAEEANELGNALATGQTIVDSHPRTRTVA